MRRGRRPPWRNFHARNPRETLLSLGLPWWIFVKFFFKNVHRNRISTEQLPCVNNKQKARITKSYSRLCILKSLNIFRAVACVWLHVSVCVYLCNYHYVPTIFINLWFKIILRKISEIFISGHYWNCRNYFHWIIKLFTRFEFIKEYKC